MKVDINSVDYSCLAGKTYIVTGGNAGIGRGIVNNLSHFKANVVYGDLSVSDNDPPNVQGKNCNVTKWDDIYRLFETATEKYGGVDGLVCNAGVMESRDFFEEKLDDKGRLLEAAQPVIDINLKAILNCIKIALFFGCRDIVMVASSRAYVPKPGMLSVTYTASKYGVVGILRGMRMNPEIKINVLAPHATDTNMLDDGKLRSTIEATKQSIQDPQRVAMGAVYHLASNWTGKTILAINNGYFELEEAYEKTISQWFDAEAIGALGSYQGARSS